MSRIEAMLKQLQTFLEQVLNREQLSSTGWEGSKIEHDYPHIPLRRQSIWGGKDRVRKEWSGCLRQTGPLPPATQNSKSLLTFPPLNHVLVKNIMLTSCCSVVANCHDYSFRGIDVLSHTVKCNRFSFGSLGVGELYLGEGSWWTYVIECEVMAGT